MSQNLISLSLTADDYAAIDQAIATLEGHLSGLIQLGVDERRGLVRMGDKSEAFCRQTLALMTENRGLVPADVGLDEAINDLNQLDLLRRRTIRLRQLAGRCEDSETALGSDVMSASLEGYALMKVLGKGSALEGLRQEISARFNRKSAGAGTQRATAAPLSGADGA